MPKQIDLGVEKDHIESLTRASGINALSELIWNALDADSTIVSVESSRSPLQDISSITVQDNGRGISYEQAQDVFGRLGGSLKKIHSVSPGGRQYHGKEGKGRLKALALGDLVTFTSRYKNGEAIKEFTITIDRNNLSCSSFSDLKTLPKNENRTGIQVDVHNINQDQARQALDHENRIEIEQKFASYWISYPDFQINFNGHPLDFDSLIRSADESSISIKHEEVEHSFVFKIIEWKIDIKKKAYLCNDSGVPFRELNIGVRTPLALSLFIQSSYIEKLQRENLLNLDSLDEVINFARNEGKKVVRDYARRRLHEQSGEFINNLKSKGLYPYKDESEGLVESSKRQVFDIVALQVNEYLPDFDALDDVAKKFTLSLIKESLENDSTSLRKILSEVVELPETKRTELVEILEDTSLSNIIDTMTEIKNRLNLINGLEQLVYDKEVSKNILERKHLHKIVASETWVFGDNYTYGVDDVTLKNVLKSYLKDHLKRDDFQEIIESEDNSDLQTIPDVCLWQQFSMGNAGKENLVIELKKPSVDAGFIEKSQIESYANRVASDTRFPKNKTKWLFYLLTKNIKPELEPSLNQKNRRYGHVVEGDNFDVFILPWGHILLEARVRLEFIKDKLNLNLSDNEEGLKYLKSKYSEYLPDNFAFVEAMDNPED